MRTLGLLFLLGGCIVMLLPKVAEMAHRYYRFDDGPMLGGALLCLGVAALILARSRMQR